MSRSIEQVFADMEADHAAKAASLGLTPSEYSSQLAAEAQAKRDAVAASDRARERRNAGERFQGRIQDGLLDSIVREDAALISTKAWEAVCKWKDSDKPILVLCGGTGSGKTVAVARYAIDKRYFQSLRAIRIGAHYEQWTSDRESKIEALDLRASLLIIDDLGQEAQEDRRSFAALEEIVDSRQSMKTRTIFTTNLTPEQIKARYPERMLSRLAQCAMVVSIPANDMRRSK